MARLAYLRLAADRAVARVPAIRPPRRLTRVAAMDPIDGPPTANASPAPVAANGVIPPRAADADRRDEAPSIVGRNDLTPEITADPIPADRGEPGYEDAPLEARPVPAVRSERRRADFVFDARHLTLPKANTSNSIRSEVRDGADPRTPPATIQREPPAEVAPPSNAPGRRVAVLPQDPFAAGLAAAERWVTSDAAPGVQRRSGHRASTVPTATHEPIHRSPPIAAEHVARPPSLAAIAKPSRAIGPSPITGDAHVADARTERTPRDTSPERLAGVHIGSVAIEILPPPEPMKPPVVAAPARATAGAVTRLARGLTSPIGLRQS